MSFIHLNQNAREAYFAGLVAECMKQDISQSAEERNMSISFYSDQTPFFKHQPLPIPYSQLTSECYAQQLIDQLNQKGGK
jgi:hypothetical protein